MATNNTITVRQKLGLILIMAALKIVQPFEYNHELDKMISEIKKELGDESQAV